MTAAPENQPAKPVSLALAFAPIHKSAMGVAVGIVAGLLLFALTLFHVAVGDTSGPTSGPNLWLLGQYFYGYRVTVQGAFVGLFWGFMTGFVIGWFTAFVRNFVVTVAVFTLRTKAELEQTTDFLDHI